MCYDSQLSHMHLFLDGFSGPSAQQVIWGVELPFFFSSLERRKHNTNTHLLAILTAKFAVKIISDHICVCRKTHNSCYAEAPQINRFDDLVGPKLGVGVRV